MARQEPLVPRALSGTARARALNRALRRIVCGEASVSERRLGESRCRMFRPGQKRLWGASRVNAVFYDNPKDEENR